MDINKHDDYKTMLNDFYVFKDKVLNVKGELEKLSNQIQSLNDNKDFVQTCNHFLTNYLPKRYGEEVKRFIINIFEKPNNVGDFLDKIEVISPQERADIDFFIFSNRSVFKRINMVFEHPFSLVSMWLAKKPKEENIVVNYSRLDGESLVLHLEPKEFVTITRNHLEFLTEYLQDDGVNIDVDNILGLKQAINELLESINKNDIYKNIKD